MERWNVKTKSAVENKKIDVFLEEIKSISKKYDLSISHEDHHGGFEIEKFSTENIAWIFNATDNT